MKYSFFTVACICLASLHASASVLEELKDTSASKYDIGKLQLELAAYVLTDKFRGEDVLDSKFEVQSFRVEEKETKLYLIGSFTGRAKYMNEAECERINKMIVKTKPFGDTHKDIWPHLSDEQKKALDQEFLFSSELVSKENESFKIQCE